MQNETVFEKRWTMDKKFLTVGVVGAGAISGIYLKNMTQRCPHLKVKSICAGHLESAQKRAAEYADFGVCAVTMEEMMEDPEIDLIVNLTPAHAHYKIIRTALEHGKHVYTEKTMTDELEKSAELTALAKEKGLYLGSAPDTFLGGSLQMARTMIEEGYLGEINSFVISANRNNDFLLSLFSFLREKGGGIVCDYGVYYVTALVSLLGPVESVSSVIRTPYPTHVNIIPGHPLFGQEMETPNESMVSAIIRMESGAVGTFHINAETIMPDQAYFLIYGTKGMLSLTDPNQFGGEVKYYPVQKDFSGPQECIPLWNYSSFCENSRGIGPEDLACAVLEGKSFRPSAQFAYHVHDTLTAILQGGNGGSFIPVRSTCDKPEPMPVRKAPITRQAHNALQVKDLPAMMDFYTNVLGMKQLFTLTFAEYLSGFPENPESEKEKALRDKVASMKDQPWIIYLKMADRQFVELFAPAAGWTDGLKDAENGWDRYGYEKMNFDVSDIDELRNVLESHGIVPDEDVHTTIDGARELAIHDPDGNILQFTEYPPEGKRRIPLGEGGYQAVEAGRCSAVNGITQTAFLVRDGINMLHFYTKGLGLRHVDRLCYSDFADALKASGAEAEAEELRPYRDQPWIDYIEAAPNQYIELFYAGPGEKKDASNPAEHFGYQHVCFEVDDIQAAWDAVTANGLVPDTPISLGCDETYQFWLTDPDGNRMEFHQYTEKSFQLQ